MSIKIDDNFIIYNLAINKLTTEDYEQALQLFEAVDNNIRFSTVVVM